MNSYYRTSFICELLRDGHTDQEDWVDWFVLVGGGAISRSVPQRIGCAHAAAIDHFSKHRVVSVERVGVGEVDVELGTPTVQVRGGTGHPQIANIVVKSGIDFQRNSLRRTSIPPSRPVTSTVLRGWVPCLNHESFDDSVPGQVGIETGLSEADKVVDGSGGLCSIEFDHYRSIGRFHGSIHGRIHNGRYGVFQTSAGPGDRDTVGAVIRCGKGQLSSSRAGHVCWADCCGNTTRTGHGELDSTVKVVDCGDIDGFGSWTAGMNRYGGMGGDYEVGRA